MKAGADGLPALGRSARSLGVRVDGPHADVRIDQRGCVLPATGGMSVTVDDPAQMPPARRPTWLHHGLSEDTLFAFGSPDLPDMLAVRIDRGAHGLVEPAAPRLLSEYEADLASTRRRWLGIQTAEA